MSSSVTDDPSFAQMPAALLDPYGQLIKMLLPRALCIAIYDRFTLPLWLSDGTDGPDLHQLVDEALATAQEPGAESNDGFSRHWEDTMAYVFILRDDARQVLGAVAVSSRETGTGRPFSLTHGLLRPALEVLSRELANQYCIGDLQKHLLVRDQDLELLLGNAGDATEPDTDDFGQLIERCVSHLGCALGALLIPERNLAVCRTATEVPPAMGAEVLTRAHRPLLAWSQSHHRTLSLNSIEEGQTLAKVPYKILACPVWQGAETRRVAGILVLFKTTAAPDFDLRQVRIVELLTRRVSYVLQSAYDTATGLLTRPAFEKRAVAALATSGPQAGHCVIYADIDRLHVLNENYGMHVGDEVIARLADMIRRSLAPRMLAARISGDRFAVFLPDCTLHAATQLADTLRDNILRLGHMVDAKPVDVSASLGVASVTPAKNPLAHALAAAEIACKAAKDRGRGRVEVYEEADKSIIRRYEDVMLVGSLHDAIANNRFRLEAQPIVPFAADHRERRYELLLRMIDTNGQSIAPSKFLLAAERYQLAPDIDRWVVQFVLETLAVSAGELEALNAHFAINISGQSIGDEDFPAFLERQLRAHKLPPRLLSFELRKV